MIALDGSYARKIPGYLVILAIPQEPIKASQQNVTVPCAPHEDSRIKTTG